MPTDIHALNQRSRQLLSTLVQKYIHDGQPVGSKTLADALAGELSPATIRNVMADLEKIGFVASPHTSAGRVPTARGYRLFVDSLLTVQPLAEQDMDTLEREFQIEINNPSQLIQTASGMLSNITSLAGLVTLPKNEVKTLRQIEFLPLSDRRVLVILVINNQEVENRVIHVDRDYTPAQLQQAANYLTQQFSGRNIQHVRQQLLTDMRNTRESMDKMMRTAIQLADQALESQLNSHAHEDYILAGQTNLMGTGDLDNVSKLRELFDAFNQKRDLLTLLDRSLNTTGVQIFIGEESGYHVLDECSVVTAPYAVDGELVGVLGVIGPTRMAYDRVIPIVDTTAKLLGAALSNHP